MGADRDVGDLLQVPDEDRAEVDPSPRYNADAGFDVQVVPNGIYVELSTADSGEPLASETEQEDLAGDGSPLQFLSPDDPEARG